jgi:hypothetical protein
MKTALRDGISKTPTSVEETAQIPGTSISAVKARLFLGGRQKLRTLYRDATSAGTLERAW